MKLLHTADWHLGKKLDNFSRYEEQVKVMEEICAIADAENVDAVLVAGDLFDTFNPPVEAVDLFYKTLKRLANNGKRAVIAIAGNHDSPDRINAPDPLARECGIIFVGLPNAEVTPFELESGLKVLNSDPGFLELKLPDQETPLRLILTPYANEIRLKQYLGAEDKASKMNEVLTESWNLIADKYCDNQGVNILISHLYMLKRGGEILEEPDGEKPLNIGNADVVYSDCIPTQMQYTALGHLHRHHNIGTKKNPVIYSSSPLAYSFSEAGQQKQVSIINIEAGEIPIVESKLLQSGRSLHRKRFENVEDSILWLKENPYALVELSIVSDEYMKAADLKRIYENHDGIINIIPILKQTGIAEEITINIADLQLDEQVLFEKYFIFKNGQKPNEEIMELFREILNPDVEELS